MPYTNYNRRDIIEQLKNLDISITGVIVFSGVGAVIEGVYEEIDKKLKNFNMSVSKDHSDISSIVVEQMAVRLEGVIEDIIAFVENDSNRLEDITHPNFLEDGVLSDWPYDNVEVVIGPKRIEMDKKWDLKAADFTLLEAADARVVLKYDPRHPIYLFDEETRDLIASFHRGNRKDLIEQLENLDISITGVIVFSGVGAVIEGVYEEIDKKLKNFNMSVSKDHSDISSIVVEQMSVCLEGVIKDIIAFVKDDSNRLEDMPHPDFLKEHALSDWAYDNVEVVIGPKRIKMDRKWDLKAADFTLLEAADARVVLKCDRRHPIYLFDKETSDLIGSFHRRRSSRLNR